MRTANLNFIWAIVFTVFFFAGGFFSNVEKVNADSSVKTYTISYSLSSVTSFNNNDGGVTTIVRVGCASGSKDLFDINTGKLCAKVVSESVRIGCASGSKDLFDINTGKPCTNKTMPVIIGCALGSGDLFDITTGKHCTNDTKPLIVGCKAGSLDLFNIVDGKPCAKSKVLVSSIKKPSINIDPKISVLPTEATNPVLSGTELTDNLGGNEQQQSNVLSANASKIGLILKGPMSIWMILLIAIIVVAGGFGIYGLINKDKTENKETEKSETPKQNKTSNVQGPTINAQPSSSTQSQTLNKTPEPVNNQQNQAPKTEPVNTPLNSVPENPIKK